MTINIKNNSLFNAYSLDPYAEGETIGGYSSIDDLMRARIRNVVSRLTVMTSALNASIDALISDQLQVLAAYGEEFAAIVIEAMREISNNPLNAENIIDVAISDLNSYILSEADIDVTIDDVKISADHSSITVTNSINGTTIICAIILGATWQYEWRYDAKDYDVIEFEGSTDGNYTVSWTSSTGDHSESVKLSNGTWSPSSVKISDGIIDAIDPAEGEKV